MSPFSKVFFYFSLERQQFNTTGRSQLMEWGFVLKQENKNLNPSICALTVSQRNVQNNRCIVPTIKRYLSFRNTS
jgi:hypothetical protein